MGLGYHLHLRCVKCVMILSDALSSAISYHAFVPAKNARMHACLLAPRYAVCMQLLYNLAQCLVSCHQSIFRDGLAAFVDCCTRTVFFHPHRLFF